MIYEHQKTGRRQEVADFEGVKRTILERSGWRLVAEERAPEKGAPEGEAPGVEWPESLKPSVVELLIAAELDHPDKVRTANDETLLAIDGIGHGTLEQLREVLGVESDQ